MMAHLVYRAPLLDEKARGKYIHTHKELTDAKNRGDIDAKSYKYAKKHLEQAVGFAIRADEELLDSDASLKLARSASVSSGSTDSRTNKSSQSGVLSRAMAGGSGPSTAQKLIRKGMSPPDHCQGVGTDLQSRHYLRPQQCRKACLQRRSAKHGGSGCDEGGGKSSQRAQALDGGL